MLTGELPYSGLGGNAGSPKYRVHFENRFKAPSESSPILQALPNQIRIEIDQLLQCCLNLEPSARFATTRSFSDALDSIWAQLQSAKTQGPPAIPREVKSWWKKLLG